MWSVLHLKRIMYVKCIGITLTLRIFGFQGQYIFRLGILVLCVRSTWFVKGTSATFARLLEVARYTFSLSYEARNCNIGLHKADRELVRGGIDAETGAGCFGVTRWSEDLLWRHLCRTNSIYCPRMSVIGRYWTFANEHGGWKVYWKAASVIWACVLGGHKLGRNEESTASYGSRVLSLNTLRDAKASIRMVLYPAV